MDLIKRSPYHHKFVEQGATFVDRLGFAAPMVFSSTEEEHRATREAVGIFDVYYQVAVEVAGRDAAAFLQRVVVADAAGLAVRRAVYTSLCNEAGGMIDDLTCFRLVARAVLAVSDAVARRGGACRIDGGARADFAVDGDQSRLQERIPVDPGPELAAASRHADRRGSLDLRAALLLVHRSDRSPTFRKRCCRAPAIPASWATSSSTRSSTRSTSGIAFSRPGDSLGIRPCGLGALRTLRLEKKYLLFGLDANDTTTPLEAGLAWTIKFDKPQFTGKEALERQRSAGPRAAHRADRVRVARFRPRDRRCNSRQAGRRSARSHRPIADTPWARRWRWVTSPALTQRKDWRSASRVQTERTRARSTFARSTTPTGFASGRNAGHRQKNVNDDPLRVAPRVPT